MDHKPRPRYCASASSLPFYFVSAARGGSSSHDWNCARSGSYQAILCLGAIVRGETPHFDFISQEVSRGVNEIGLRYSIGVGFGVLTTDTMEQALARSGEGHGNKGYEAAVTALEMQSVLAEIVRRS